MRASPPPVTVLTNTDFWLAELRAGRCFTRGIITAAPDATHSAYMQLLNPVASGVQLIIFGLFFNINNLSGSVDVQRQDTALGTLVGTGFNLLLGGAAGHGELRTDITTNPAGTVLAQINQGNQQQLMPPGPWLAELSPGQGIQIKGGLNTPGSLTVFWREGA